MENLVSVVHFSLSIAYILMSIFGVCENILCIYNEKYMYTKRRKEENLNRIKEPDHVHPAYCCLPVPAITTCGQDCYRNWDIGPLLLPSPLDSMLNGAALKGRSCHCSQSSIVTQSKTQRPYQLGLRNPWPHTSSPSFPPFSHTGFVAVSAACSTIPADIHRTYSLTYFSFYLSTTLSKLPLWSVCINTKPLIPQPLHLYPGFYFSITTVTISHSLYSLIYLCIDSPS